MERLSPKGDKSTEAVPLGRMGDGGKSSCSSYVLLSSCHLFPERIPLSSGIAHFFRRIH